MNYIIKKLSKAELAFAKQLFMFFQEDDGIEKPTLANDKYLQELISNANYHVFVALDGEKVIGGVTAYELPMYYGQVNEMFLYEIAVRQEYRRQGIAAALIENLKSLCAEKGVRIIFVGTEKSNLAAKELYLNTGGTMEIIPWFTYNLKHVK